MTSVSSMPPVVVFIESPGICDISLQYRTGEPLATIVRLMGLLAFYHPIHTKSLLEPSLRTWGSAAKLIHIAAHGEHGSLAFTDASFIDKNELRALLWRHCGSKVVALDFCGSSEFMTIDLAEQLDSDVPDPPRCVVAVKNVVDFVDSVLSWGVFYRHLLCQTSIRGGSDPSPRDIYDSLKAVKTARLHPMHAVFWCEKRRRFINITPGDMTVKDKLELGLVEMKFSDAEPEDGELAGE